MFKTIFKIFLILFPCFSFAEKSFNFYLEPHIAFSHGTIGEYLYDNSDTDRLLSRLDWERNLFLYGAEAGVSFWRLNFSADFSSSVPKNFGKMHDSDWMNDYHPDMKTTYSVGDNKAVKNHEALLSLSFDFFPFSSSSERTFVISPLAQFHYSFDSFERTDAEGWYGQSRNSSDGKNHWWYESEAEHLPRTYWNDSKGRYVTRRLAGISYERKFYSFFTGIRFKLKVSEKISGNLGLMVAPFARSEVEDVHNGYEPRHYKHVQTGYWDSAKLSFGGSFSASKKIDITLNTELFFMNLLKGSYALENKKDPYYRTGGKQFAVSARLGIRANIFPLQINHRQ